MPIASLELQKTGLSGTSAAGRERRRKGRARVSREMRIRAADFNDGSFEEVCSTLNFSRDGLYFLTPHDRYHVGMRLRIAPAQQPRTQGAWENLGKVVRVHRQGVGFGVAVFLSHDAVARAEAAAECASSLERRSVARLPFVASTEIIDVRTAERRRARVADLSTQGCYIDTLNPLPLYATVQMQIEKGDACVEFRAKVVASHLGLGMGLVFEGMTSEQRSMLTKWVRGESAALAAGCQVLSRRQSGTESEGRFPQDPRLLKLLNVLTSKGILSESEEDALLHDR